MTDGFPLTRKISSSIHQTVCNFSNEVDNFEGSHFQPLNFKVFLYSQSIVYAIYPITSEELLVIPARFFISTFMLGYYYFLHIMNFVITYKKYTLS